MHWRPCKKKEDEVESLARRRRCVGQTMAGPGWGSREKWRGAHRGSVEVGLEVGDGRKEARRRQRWDWSADERRGGCSEAEEGGEVAEEIQWSKGKLTVTVDRLEGGRREEACGGSGKTPAASGVGAVRRRKRAEEGSMSTTETRGSLWCHWFGRMRTGEGRPRVGGAGQRFLEFRGVF